MTSKPRIYLISGQGADSRLFRNLNLDSAFEIRHIDFETPKSGQDMQSYAHQISKQFDNASRKIIIGVSIGGMIATELSEILEPEMVIVVSSAKCRKEIPKRYRLLKFIPFHKVIPSRVIKTFAKLLQPLVEPDQNKESETFYQMLNDKDPKFLKRTINMIISWNRKNYSKDIIHIHGNRDNTIPIKCVKCDHIVEGGSHMMMLTRGSELSVLINKILEEERATT